MTDTPPEKPHPQSAAVLSGPCGPQPRSALRASAHVAWLARFVFFLFFLASRSGLVMLPALPESLCALRLHLGFGVLTPKKSYVVGRPGTVLYRGALVAVFSGCRVRSKAERSVELARRSGRRKMFRHRLKLFLNKRLLGANITQSGECTESTKFISDVLYYFDRVFGPCYMLPQVFTFPTVQIASRAVTVG
ncbi:hypothetical protein B0H14DRAFT_2558749 [Mycena olivaceomarginata]|nr:hypothetical protein B0H14DRAFT_2558749 [Mycena olivaceomarginata]